MQEIIDVEKNDCKKSCCTFFPIKIWVLSPVPFSALFGVPNSGKKGGQKSENSSSWQFFVTFLGWLTRSKVKWPPTGASKRSLWITWFVKSCSPNLDFNTKNPWPKGPIEQSQQWSRPSVAPATLYSPILCGFCGGYQKGTWMSRWKLGSMVRINGLVITYLLTFDPNFLGHPSKELALLVMGTELWAKIFWLLLKILSTWKTSCCWFPSTLPLKPAIVA